MPSVEHGGNTWLIVRLGWRRRRCCRFNSNIVMGCPCRSEPPETTASRSGQVSAATPPPCAGSGLPVGGGTTRIRSDLLQPLCRLRRTCPRGGTDIGDCTKPDQGSDDRAWWLRAPERARGAAGTGMGAGTASPSGSSGNSIEGREGSPQPPSSHTHLPVTWAGCPLLWASVSLQETQASRARLPGAGVATLARSHRPAPGPTLEANHG